MRYLRIFLLHLEHIFEHRARSFVWFLIALIHPLVLLLFWKGTLAANQGEIAGWQLPTITTYYFLLVIAGSLLMPHIEEDISERDIQAGGLVTYLVRPFPYYWMKFIQELPYRILQGTYGLMICLLFFLFFGNLFTFSSSPPVLFASVIIAILGYLLAFYFKVIIGLVTFWVIDIGGLYQLVEIIIAIFAGYIMPLELFTDSLRQIAFVLPFSYMIYFPIVAFQGKLTVIELLRVISTQIIWLFLLYVLYRWVWSRGIKKFTGMGQ